MEKCIIYFVGLKSFENRKKNTRHKAPLTNTFLLQQIHTHTHTILST